MNQKLLTYVALAALPFSVMAQTAITWDGSDSTDFATAGNWTGDIAPTNDLTSNIGVFSGAATVNQPNLAVDRSIYGFDFQSGGWTLSGSQFTLGAGGITSTGNNEITAALANSGNTTYSSASGGTLTVNAISGGTVTFGTAVNTGTVELKGTADNANFSPIVDYGTVILNKGDVADGNFGSAVNNLTVNENGTVRFGSNLTSRDNANNRGQIYGTATVDGTMDLNGQGLTYEDTYNWNMAGLRGTGTVVNNGSGSAEISVSSGSFAGQLNDGTSTTALRVLGDFRMDGGAGGTYSGGTIVDNAQIEFRSSEANVLGTGDITLKNGARLRNYKNSLTFANNIVLGDGGAEAHIGWDESLTLNGLVSGTGSLTVLDDSATVKLNNAGNTFSGGLTIIDDTVHAAGYTSVEGVITGNSVGLGDITFNGGNLVATAGNNLGTRGIHLEAAGGSIRMYNNRVVAHDGTIDGTGALTIGNDGGTLRLKGANTYSGGTEIQGKVWVESGGLGTGDVTLNNAEGTDRGHLQNYNNGEDVLANNIIIHDNGGHLQAGWNIGLTLNGVVSGSGDLGIVGDSGTVVLGNAANTYSGAISLESIYNEDESLKNSAKLSLESLGAGATISGDVDATLTFTGDIALDSVSGFLGVTTLGDGGSFTGSGTLAGGLALGTGSELNLNETLSVAGLVALVDGDTFGIADVLGLSSATADGTYTLIDTTATDFSTLGLSDFGVGNAFDLGDGKSAYFENGSLTVTVIPEPATLGLVAAFGGAVLFIRRRFMI